LPNIPFSRVKTVGEAKEFLATHGTIIAKPLRGSGSKGIHVIRSAVQLDTLVVSEYILERYTPGREMRYLILQGQVIAVHESKYGESVAYDRELERISYDVEHWDPVLIAQSLEIARVLGLSFGAVDYIIDTDGRHFILEVNSCPGFKWFHAPSEGPAIDVATMFLHATINSSTQMAI
jgi:D-alanine-D-alanine ligase